MNKHSVILFAAVCAAVLLTSCSGSVVPPETAPPASVTASAEAPVPPAGLADALSGLWVRIDGSTATIPLTTALHGFFGGAGSPPTHYTTSSAYYNLFHGSKDLILVTYPSEKELSEARDLGMELDIIPIAKDALVFLANIENPVDGVSLQQLCEIYTGKITNWKTLGGLDENIAPYQRTQGSGSQTLLNKLVMDGLEPVKPPEEWVAESMGALVEVVSSYDNAREAIGYSMFYYVNNMYGNSSFKLLGVDGVKPSRETITRGEYPLEDYYYAVVRKDMPADSPARQLIDWLRTDDGQTVAARAGYIPLRPLANVFPDETMDPVYLGDVDNSSGTGGTELKPSGAIDEIVVNGVRKPLSALFYDGFNYIRYINSEITSWLNSPESASLYSPGPLSSGPAAENAKRAFTGIPNDYPSYELADMDKDSRYLYINLPESNPFFNGPVTFRIRLTSDISPYGIGIDDFSVVYHYGRRMLPNVDLFTLDVKLTQSPDVAERINSQLKAWTDGFPGDNGKTKLLDMFVKWYADGWYVEHPENAYRLQPAYGRWGDYLSVSFPLQTYDGPWFNMPVLYTICFDMKTGKAVNLAEQLPRDIPYSKGMILDPITKFEAGTGPSQANYENYVPAEGSVITSAWLGGNALGLYVTEPSGRKLQVNIYDWA
ncbi:ABC-type phosphate transport system, substrate-binding protein [Sporobacter termitidis DSM 10068]|uniref:ABC-type phosphate transport system, substrate-binding protein n=1 Tax=Sporobacter termitidis DSM 10068 TaxID=1123282 RepID=A0A1M5W9X3_9FIRM|nr:substrate-binding domain-containing protein [Sporobacter termitidis]SHH84379.1 ABC-type phosphate transport system, substrate-binding protein [Sporobacter termitidis DSM 10068]